MQPSPGPTGLLRLGGPLGEGGRFCRWRRCGGVRRQVLADRGVPVVELGAKGSAVGGAGGLDVLEGERLPGVLGTYRPAQEATAVEHPDLTGSYRIVTGSPT